MRESNPPRRQSVIPRVIVAGALIVASVGLYSSPGAAAQTGSAIEERPLAVIVVAPVPLRDGIGVVHERVTTSSAQASAFYNQGVSYLHSFVWIEAARSFNQALRLDPNLAMAQVGLSYALGELGLSADARRASDRAQRLTPLVTPRETMMIRLRKAQLDVSATPNDAAVRAAYRKLLSDAAATFPDDVELLLLVGQAQDVSHDDHGMNVGSASLPFYLQALAKAPEYFATHHLLTHAYENTRQFDQALVHAERYARMASAIPHAHHMYGHVLRRVNRMKDAIAQFEEADRLNTAYLRSESIPARYDWHYRHNLSLLGSSYQYLGRMASADAVLRRSFVLDAAAPTGVNLDRKQWVLWLLATRRPSDALPAAQSLIARRQPIEQALGHLLSGRSLLALKKPSDAAAEGNAALAAMRAAGPSGGVLVPEYELLQGEYLLRTGQAERGRVMLRSAAAKLRDASGPDAWVTTLFSFEAIARTAIDVGEWPLAEELAAHMRELDGGYPGTEYVRGLIAEHDGNHDAALADYQAAVRGWADADATFPGLLDARARISARPSPGGLQGR